MIPDRPFCCGRKALAAAALALVLLTVALHYGVGPLAARALRACRAAGPLAFFAGMAILPAFGFPLFPFVVSAAPAFAPRLGTGLVVAYSIAAVAVDLALSYGLGSGALRPAAVRVVRVFGTRLPDLSRAGAWETTLLVRLLPGTPFFLQGLGLALVRVPFRIYMAASLLVCGGYCVAFALLGRALLAGNALAIAAAALLLVLISVIVNAARVRLLRLRRRPA